MTMVYDCDDGDVIPFAAFLRYMRYHYSRFHRSSYAPKKFGNDQMAKLLAVGVDLGARDQNSLTNVFEMTSEIELDSHADVHFREEAAVRTV